MGSSTSLINSFEILVDSVIVWYALHQPDSAPLNEAPTVTTTIYLQKTTIEKERDDMSLKLLYFSLSFI